MNIYIYILYVDNIICMYVIMYIYIYIYIYVYIYMYIYVYMYIYMYTYIFYEVALYHVSFQKLGRRGMVSPISK